MTISFLVDLAGRELPSVLSSEGEVHAALNLETASLIEAQFSCSGPRTEVNRAVVTKVTLLGKKQVAKIARLRGSRRVQALSAGGSLA